MRTIDELNTTGHIQQRQMESCVGEVGDQWKLASLSGNSGGGATLWCGRMASGSFFPSEVADCNACLLYYILEAPKYSCIAKQPLLPMLSSDQ